MKIVFHGQNAKAFRPDFESLLKGPHEITLLPDALTSEQDRRTYAEADVIIGIKLDATLPNPTRARLYHAPAAGTDAIDQKLLPAGAALCNCHGHERAIAEYVMTALLLRHVPIPEADRDLRRGQWTYWWGFAEGARNELGSTSIGLLGFGHIGREIAARAKAFGMRVTVCNRSPVELGPLVDAYFPLSARDAFMASADAIVVGLPLLPETTGFVGAKALAAMKPSGVLINVARGPVVDEQALYDALKSKAIAGAIIDTWYVYPSPKDPSPLPARLPFHTLDNCVLTPHMSGWTSGTIRRRQETMADNIERLRAGQPLINTLG
jgi:phosphoglycerate dehydrogenase-like enzyme